ncbi:MAG: SDR family NAD(P)-dependent oxidoreductase [Proteobacteria bacterium]|nr:SDR family NAD(P)-dependent oxidoreductase [Pseudomonadota bacterium]HQR04847.1 SDR family NAD(P)-dependent oxidoreductase [Rhodocyclaceae bacterium]
MIASSPTALAGRVALVTGASKGGIGRAIARRLAAHGARIVITASGRTTGGLDKTVDLIAAAGGTAVAITANLADPAARADLIGRASVHFGPPDILVNNAAIGGGIEPPSSVALALRHDIMEVNLQAPIDLIQQALPAMREKGWGRILNITSKTAEQPALPYKLSPKFIHGLAFYGASKAALDRYTLGLAAELHASGIHVNAMAPHQIAVTEGAEALARSPKTHPADLEPLEMMAEAAFVLIAGAFTGQIVTSRQIVGIAQQPLHSLDGRTPIGDAGSLFRFGP